MKVKKARTQLNFIIYLAHDYKDRSLSKLSKGKDPVLHDQEILQSMDDAPEEDDVLLMQNIFTSEIFIFHTNCFNDPKGFDLSRGKMSIVRFKDIFFFLSRPGLLNHRRLISGSLLALVPFCGFYGLFSFQLDLHQPSILFHVVGGRRGHDAWLNRFDRK